MRSTLYSDLTEKIPCVWLNPGRGDRQSAQAEPEVISRTAIDAAAARLQRFAPLLAHLFPELESAAGLIESDLIDASSLQQALQPDDPNSQRNTPNGRWLIKADHALPVAGSIKARGGIHEVLEYAETLALQHGLLDIGGDYATLGSVQSRQLFSRYKVAVGSTGNLGLSIGVIAAALGFQAIVHMSAEAKEWKKQRLRQRGVAVVEHPGDYEQAVAAGRNACASDPMVHFVDDERSTSLFVGYAVAALRLQNQLQQKGIAVSPAAPLLVYLPCGVGGAPAGIAYGLHQVFGANVHCFFAEPAASPCFMLGMMYPDRPGISVYDVGLDNRTAADGLAVPTASQLAITTMRPILSGVFIVDDDRLFRDLYLAQRKQGIRIEPSAAAGFSGPAMLQHSAAGQAYLAQNGLTPVLHNATHLLWTTGGLFVPEAEYQTFLQRGEQVGHQQ